ncbi:MAG: 2-C-methyl-D-erythritol 4-phosphate cytidylyltransferase [Bacteroidales bacterium]|jgi:2-C-methyl-D-erythritol 4-phosphate cytidylyltransferase
MNICVILAGGTGKRLGFDIPKQFIFLNRMPIIEYSIKIFNSHKKIDNILIVCNGEYINFLKELVNFNKYSKVCDIISGGEERYLSALNAINYIKKSNIANLNECNILFHDAARPLITNKIIDNVIEALNNYQAVTVAIPSTDTLYFLDDDKSSVSSIPDRSHLVKAQTPQAFRMSLIDEAYQKALNNDNVVPTDDCSVVVKYTDYKPYIVKGSSDNIKITYDVDIKFAEQILRKNK